MLSLGVLLLGSINIGYFVATHHVLNLVAGIFALSVFFVTELRPK